MYSALQHAIITNETYGPPDPALGLQYHDFRTTGGLAFTQLAELRHRGAFSTVSQTFAACCTRCIKTEDSKIAGLPQDWYQVSHSKFVRRPRLRDSGCSIVHPREIICTYKAICWDPRHDNRHFSRASVELLP